MSYIQVLVGGYNYKRNLVICSGVGSSLAMCQAKHDFFYYNKFN